MLRRTFIGGGMAFLGAGFVPRSKRFLLISMTGGPSHTDLFDFHAGPWTPDWMDPVHGFPRGLLPRLADRLDQIRLIRGLRAPNMDHSLAQQALPACDLSIRAGRATFAEACYHARHLMVSTRSMRIDFGSWDHHGNLYENLRPMGAAFDCGLSWLMDAFRRDRRAVRIVAMGEFGRAPGPLNQNRGRDHHPVHAALTWELA